MNMNRIFLIIIISIISSQTSYGAERATASEKEIQLGWVTPNKYRVIATGVPDPEITTKSKRRESAADNAVSKAWKKIANRFVKERLTNTKKPVDYSSTGYVITREFKQLIKNGKVLKIRYNKDDSCEIVYQVEGRFLKERVQGNL